MICVSETRAVIEKSDLLNSYSAYDLAVFDDAAPFAIRPRFLRDLNSFIYQNQALETNDVNVRTAHLL